MGPGRRCYHCAEMLASSPVSMLYRGGGGGPRRQKRKLAQTKDTHLNPPSSLRLVCWRPGYKQGDDIQKIYREVGMS